MIGQDIRADAPSPRRSVITLAVVGASGAIPVPRLNGLTLAAAKRRAAARGLRVESERQRRRHDARRRHRGRHRRIGTGSWSDGRDDHAADGPPNGELTQRDPASTNRHGCSTAFVIPIRRVAATSARVPRRSRNAPPSRAAVVLRPDRERRAEPAGPRHQSRSGTPGRRAAIRSRPGSGTSARTSTAEASAQTRFSSQWMP